MAGGYVHVDAEVKLVAAEQALALAPHRAQQSLRVAERLGMKPIRSDEMLGAEVVVYAISREEWERL